MKFFFQDKTKLQELQSPTNFVSIFHVKFNLDILFIRCIIGKISDIVSSSWHQTSIDSEEDMSASEIRDFSNLKSALEFLKNNIATTTNLVVEGYAFRLMVRCSKENYKVDLNLEMDKQSSFYYDFVTHIELEDDQILVSME